MRKFLFFIILLSSCVVYTTKDEIIGENDIDTTGASLIEEAQSYLESLSEDSILKALEKESPRLSIETKKFGIEIPEERREIARWVLYFQTRGRKRLERAYVRMLRYLPLVKEILLKEGLPEELAYLPIVESNYNPYARSRAGAVGIWQFMKSTARKYGLRVDWWIDERRDPVKSTEAAARYFKDLFELFGRWDLILCAYNAGEGKLLRKVRKNGSIDFWELKRLLPRETREYVPAFFATLLIFKDPEGHGFNFDTIKVEPFDFDTVRVPKPADLKLLAKWAGVSVKTIRRLNPQFLRWATPPYMRNFILRIPKGKRDRFIAYMSRDKRKSWVSVLIHRVRRGETLSQIARRYGVSQWEIVRVNNIRNRHLLRVGQVLKIPVPNGSKPRKRSYAKMGGKIYTVRKGDSLWKISRRFGIPIEKLKRWNRLRGTRIYPGQKLIIEPSQSS
jgi:membrane-bound lytic murein transglycosylase D